jgi:hypothetical protein
VALLRQGHHRTENRRLATAPATSCQFRAAAGEHPGDERFAELIHALQEESERFCEWWSRYNVEQALTGQITVRHPDVGTIHSDVIEVKFPAHPGLTMSVHVPARPADRDKITHLV